MNINMLGIDIAKNVFQLHGVDKAGKVLLKKRLSRSALLPFIAELAPCLIVMEACGGANYWRRQFMTRGHTVKLISPQYVKPFVKTNKSDSNDAEAICEAASRPSMYFVPGKSIEQQDIQALHRVRSRLIGSRTALANQIRGLLAEYGIIIPQGIWHVRRQLPLILEDAENELTVQGRALFSSLYAELVELDKQIKQRTSELSIIFEEQPACQRIAQVEGIGLLSATAFLAAVGDPGVFKNGRQLAAWLGLVPRHHNSGEKSRQLGISKRGDTYLRKLLVHGARSVVYRASSKEDKRSLWINHIAQTRGMNKACVALANKNARVLWALLKHEQVYQAVS